MNNLVTTEFKRLLADRYTTAELAEFLDITVEDFCEMFEADIEYNYADLCEVMQYNNSDEDEELDSEAY